MAPKIKVPADFGREHINSPVHGNLVLKLRDGQEIKTNSMIMSLNSPVIDNLTTNLTQSSLEMDDFTKEAVDCFVESLYTGEVESLKKQIFEDVNKMAYVFEVSWLTKRCLKFYKMDVLNYEKNSYQEIVFACEIASRAHYNLKQSHFVSYFVRDLMSKDFSKALFLTRYLANFSERSIRQIDMSIAVAGMSYDLLLMPLISHLSSNLKCESLDKNSLYLLQKLSVPRFCRDHPVLFKNILSLLLEISEVCADSYEVKEIIRNFTENFKGTDSCSNHDDIVETVEESLSDIRDDEECSAVATQTDVEPEHCWVQVTTESKYPVISEDSVHLITLSNKPTQNIFVYYYFVSKEGQDPVKKYFTMMPGINADSPWSYTIQGCTPQEYNKRFLDNVPSDKVKHWKLTKTFSNLIIKCNKVTVLDFKFDHDCDPDKKSGHKVWSRNLEPEIMLKMFECDSLLTMK